MTQHEAQQFADSLFAGFFGFVLFLFWLAYAISATRSLRRIRQEAEKQTELLVQIARNTAPPAGDKRATATESAVAYGLREPKSGAGTLLAILGSILVLGVIYAMATKK